MGRDREVDEKLAWLCHLEYEGGIESVEVEVAELPRDELERLLGLAVIEIMESRADAEREIARYAAAVERAALTPPLSRSPGCRGGLAPQGAGQ